MTNDEAQRLYTYRLPVSEGYRCFSCMHFISFTAGCHDCRLLNIAIADGRRSRCPKWVSATDVPTCCCGGVVTLDCEGCKQ